MLGLVASLLVIVFFVVPAILNGESPQGVALVGALAVMLVTIVLAHGIGPKAIAACLGTASALLLTLFLADFFVEAAHLSLAGTPFREAVGFEIVAAEVVATLVGSIGLIAAVPLTTWATSTSTRTSC